MIAVIGSANMDITLTTDRFTTPGETQPALSISRGFGGKGANQAVAVHNISGKAPVFCAALGDDQEGEAILKELNTHGIKGPLVLDAAETGKAYIELTKTGENRIIVYPGSNERLTPHHITEFLNTYEEKTSIALLQNELPVDTIQTALSVLKQKSISIVYDPAPVKTIQKNFLNKIDYITPNESELEGLCSILEIPGDTIFNKAERLQEETGILNIVLKRGARGCAFLSKENSWTEFPAPKVEVTDTTGAGDVFNAAFAVALNESMNIKDALRFAVCAASLSVQKAGAQSAVPNRRDVDSFLKKNC
ncbi:MAG: ribokinase [Spirochaetia bacterium]